MRTHAYFPPPSSFPFFLLSPPLFTPILPFFSVHFVKVAPSSLIQLHTSRNWRQVSTPWCILMPTSKAQLSSCPSTLSFALFYCACRRGWKQQTEARGNLKTIVLFSISQDYPPCCSQELSFSFPATCCNRATLLKTNTVQGGLAIEGESCQI